MRPALIIVSLATALLAAPVPSENAGQLARRVPDANAVPMDAAIDKRHIRGTNGEKDRVVQEIHNQKRSGVKFNDRSEEDGAEAEEKRSGVKFNDRSDHDGTETEEKRSGVKFNDRSEEDGAEVEERAVRQGVPRAVRQGVPRAVRQGVPRAVRQGVPRAVRQGVPRAVRQGVPRSADEEEDQVE